MTGPLMNSTPAPRKWKSRRVLLKSALALIGVAAVVEIGFGDVESARRGFSGPQFGPSETPIPTATHTSTPTSVPPSLTPTDTFTPTQVPPSLTPTDTFTPTPGTTFVDSHGHIYADRSAAFVDTDRDFHTN